MKEYIVFDQFRLRYWFISFCKDSKFLIKHRENDKPAFISSKGITAWYNNGKWYETGT